MNIDIKRNPKKPLVFIGTPTANVKDYCWDLFYERVSNLSYPHYTFMVADNSKSNKYSKELRKEGATVLRIKPKDKTNIAYVCESHNILRDAFLKSKASYFLHLESDIIPPPDIIERLMIHKKSVVGAAYFIKFGDESHLMVSTEEKNYENDTNILHTILLEKNGSDFNIMDGKIHKVHSVGLGCVLIHRSVMEQIPFRYDKNVYAHPDSFFAIDCRFKNIPVYIDTDILCEHYNSEWIHF
jgi:hypothetical protein